MMRARRAVHSALLAGFLAGVAAPARADVSSWLFVGAGPSVFDYSLDGDTQVALDITTGMGTPPTGIVSVGVVGRFLPHIGHGTDLALALRGATRGYTQGSFGIALDAGGFRRFWGTESTGFIGNLGVGLPWGFVLNASGAAGTNDTKMAVVTLGIDFARLTVYRTAGESWWRNPFPATREAR